MDRTPLPLRKALGTGKGKKGRGGTSEVATGPKRGKVRQVSPTRTRRPTSALQGDDVGTDEDVDRTTSHDEDVTGPSVTGEPFPSTYATFVRDS